MKNQSVQYALMCLQALEDREGNPCSARDLSRDCGVPYAECVTVLKKLVVADIVHEAEAGLYSLHQSVCEISALTLITALATPLRKVTTFKMHVGAKRGQVVKKTLEAIAWSRGMDVYPSENGTVGK